MSYPPDYIKVPLSIACAAVEDALIVTMARILGLCWEQKYRRCPPYTPDQLADLLGRARTTLYRHLNKLEQLGWLRVDHCGRQLVLQPLVRVVEGQSPAAGRTPEPAATGKDAQSAALQEAGIVGRPLRELLQQGVDPALVRAWHLWTWVPEQDWLDNPAGYVVQRLREGDEPPAGFLELARLTPEETALLVDAWAGSEQYVGWPSLDGNDRLRSLAPLWATVHAAMNRCRP